MKTSISGHTRLIGLFAKPIRHSISPMIQNAALSALGIDAVYLAFDVEKQDMSHAIQSIHTLEMIGANISMPNKQVTLEFMDELSDSAKLIGAVNTIVNDEGRLIGHNTDGIGFIRSLKEKGIDAKGKRMTIIGAGGAATSIIVQAALDGMDEIKVFNLKDSFYDKLEKLLPVIAESSQCKITLHDLNDVEMLREAIHSSDILTNATGMGMSPHQDKMSIPDVDVLHDKLFVADVVYNPRETLLIKNAKERGCQTMNGLGMLLYQGAEAFQLWTGQEMPIDVVRPVLENS